MEICEDEAGAGHCCAQAAFWRAEAQRWEQRARGLEQVEVGLRAQAGDLEGQLAALKQTVATLSQALYGDSSEKRSACAASPDEPPPGQGLAGGDAGAGDAGAGDAGGGDAGAGDAGDEAAAGGEEAAGEGVDGGGDAGGGGRRRRGQQPGSRGHGRRDYSYLPGDERVHEPDPERLVCPACGQGYVPFGEECSEQLDWEVVVRRVVHRRPSWRRGCDCAEAKGVVAASPPARAIPRGRLSSGFIARLVVAKFGLGLPVNRIVALLETEGASFAPGTLAGTLGQAAGLLAPVAEAIRVRNAADAHLHIDETSWKVFEPLAGKANNRWWLWAFVGSDTTVFALKPGRGAWVVAEHVGIDLDADTPVVGDGHDLVISSDFYTPYQRLGRDVQGVVNAWCWAHMRRYFLRAGQGDATLALWSQQWLERIGALFGAHRRWAMAPAGSDIEADARQQVDKAISDIDSARRTQAADTGLAPAAGEVLATLDREWDGLLTFLEHPGVPLDNNTAERALRGPVVLRKNCYGSGSHRSAQLAADAWTILATLARHHINPTSWLTAYFDACAAAGGRPPPAEVLARLLPFDHQTANPPGLTTPRRTPP